MSGSFINLNCARCGAKLDIYEDMERFSCGYCGTGMSVQRRGGTVSLEPVIEPTQEIQIRTDHATAELATTRFEREGATLNGKVAASGCLVACLGLVCCVVLFAGMALVYSR